MGRIFILNAVICVIVLIIVWMWLTEGFIGMPHRWSFKGSDWEDPVWSDQHDLRAIGGTPVQPECLPNVVGPDIVLTDEVLAEARADPEVAKNGITLRPYKRLPARLTSIAGEVNYEEHLGACPAERVEVCAARGARYPRVSANPILTINRQLDPVLVGENEYAYKI
jgi:hypothetical protein